MASKVKPLEAKAFDQSSAAGPSLSILNNGSQNTESVDHMVAPTNKSTLHKGVDFDEANGNSTQSVSANDLKKNIKEQAHTKDSNVQNDAKKQANTSDSNTRNGFNKQAEGTNSIVQNMKQQEHAINSSNQSAEVAPQKSPVPLPVHTEHTPEAGKYDGNTGNSISSDSKSNTAPQPDNKSPAGVHASDADAEDQNDDNEFMSTDENADVHDTDVAVNTPSGDDDDQDEERMNSDHEGNFYTYCLIKNIFVLAVLFFLPTYFYTHTHTHVGSLMLVLSFIYSVQELGHLSRYSDKAAGWRIDD
jgi:hypothetical protein